MQRNSGTIKTEKRIVCEKVSKTKREIEELKAQLQNLISEGLKKPVPADSVRFVPPTEHSLTIPIEPFKLSPNNKPKSSSNKQPAPLETTPKRTIAYDKEKARDFIRKQREKHKEQMKDKRIKADLTQDLKKQRLQELRQKSLQLVNKSIKKKREPKAESVKSSSIIHKNITVRETHPILETSDRIPKQSPELNKMQLPAYFGIAIANRAAVRIQAVFRGYRQRKLYKQLLKKHKISKQVQTNNFVWLGTPTAPYPHNFFNAVRRKLNLAVQQFQLPQTTNVSVQAENVELKSFWSHKCLTDVDSMQNGNDSDTSKNIPDLSSESSRNNKRVCAFDPFSNSNKHLKKIKLPESLAKLNESIIAQNRCGYSRPYSNCDSLKVSNVNFVRPTSLISDSPPKQFVSTQPVCKDTDDILKTNELDYTNNDESKFEVSKVSHIAINDIKSKIGTSFLRQSTVTLETKSNSFQSNKHKITCDNRLDNIVQISSQNLSVGKPLSILTLKAPSISLKSYSNINSEEELGKGDESASSRSYRNTNVSVNKVACDKNAELLITPNEKSNIQTEVNSNGIHLKFEAELHLLNEFNESLQQVMAIEKSLVELQTHPTSFGTRDTQTSIKVSTINYERGCDFADNSNASSLSALEIKDFRDNIKDNNETIMPYLVDKVKSMNAEAGLSLDLFDRLIKDEDARIENLKAVLKVREKSLVDRTKGELAWLEVQKRHLRDSGQLQEISAIKKKQRGLLIKLEHERHEMQRLRVMQKAASRQRKLVLKEERNNVIKSQLSTCTATTKIKRTPREYKRASGPLKVYNIRSCSDTIASEGSISDRSSIHNEDVPVMSIASQVSAESYLKSIQDEKVAILVPSNKITIETECIKRSMLMREEALQKRRIAAEELLQWHQRLVEEEEKITQLELAAIAIINQIPALTNQTKHRFKGSQLNLLWKNMTGRNEHKFNDKEEYSMSWNALQRFCKDAKKCTVGAAITNIMGDYTLDFESFSEKKKLIEDTTIDEDLPDDPSDVKLSATLIEGEVLTIGTQGMSSETNIDDQFLHTDECISSNNTIIFETSKMSNNSCSNMKDDITKENLDITSLQTETKSRSSTSILEDNTQTTNEATSKISEISSSFQKNEIVSESNNKSDTCNNNSTCKSLLIFDSKSEVGNETLANHVQDVDTCFEIAEQIHDVDGINTLYDDIYVEGSKDAITENHTFTFTNSHILQIQNELNEYCSKSRTSENMTTLNESKLLSIVCGKDTESQIDQQATTSDNTDIVESHSTEHNEVIKVESKCNETFIKTSKEETITSVEVEPITSSSFNSIDIDRSNLNEESIADDLIYNTKCNNTDENSRSKTDNKSFRLCEKQLNAGNEENYIKNFSTTDVNDCLTVANDNQLNFINNDEKTNVSLTLNEIELISKSSIGDHNISISTLTLASEIPEEFVIETNSLITNTDSLVKSNVTKSNFTNEGSSEVDASMKNQSNQENILITKNDVIIEREKTSSQTSVDVIDASLINQSSSKIIPFLDQDSSDNEEINTDDSSQLSHDTDRFLTSEELHTESVDIKITQVNDKDENENKTSDKMYIPGRVTPTSEKDNESAELVHSIIEKVDVKKRVSEILTEANLSSPRFDKSPRMHNLYVTAFDVADDELKDGEVSPAKQIDNEVQQLLKKQLEIENEIKKIQQQQQKEQLPYLYVREIPNKPPPPYTPPLTISTHAPSGSVLPANEKHLASITTTVASILYTAVCNNNIHQITLSSEYKHQTSFEFIFDLCKEAAIEHYNQFDEEEEPLWMCLRKSNKLAVVKPFTQNELNIFLLKRMKQLLGYNCMKSNDSFKRKWSSKKRDHVDELLVIECQEDEADWVNYYRDELVVKEDICKDIMDMLIGETAQVFNNIINKKAFLY